MENINKKNEKDIESMNTQTQNCAPIQCTVWPRNDVDLQAVKSTLS